MDFIVWRSRVILCKIRHETPGDHRLSHWIRRELLTIDTLIIPACHAPDYFNSISLVVNAVQCLAVCVLPSILPKDLIEKFLKRLPDLT